MYSIYTLKCDDGSYYTGFTSNLTTRLKKHYAKTATWTTKIKHPVKLVHTETFSTKQEALKREKQLKGWTRAKKEALITGNFESLKQLSKGR